MGSGPSRSSQVHSFQNTQENAESNDIRPHTGRQSKRVPSASSNQRTSPLKRSKSLASNVAEKRQSPPPATPPQKVLETDSLYCPSQKSMPDPYEKQSDAEDKLTSLQEQLTQTESENLDLQDRIQMLEERLEYLNSCHQIPEETEDFQETLKAKDQYISKLEKEQKQQAQEFNKTKARYKKRIKMLTTQLNEAKHETSIQMFELKDEIKKLHEKNKKLEDSLRKSNGKSSESEVPDIGKMQIVLELSNQISDQTEKITKLEKEIKEKDSVIASLGGPPKVDNYDREQESQDNLRKLSLGLSQYNKNSEIRDSDEELRGVSGASRDSGLGSAGKTERDKAEKVINNLSKLSDSDWESDELPENLSHPKVKSAPVETQALRAASRLASRESIASRLPSRLASRESSFGASRQASRESYMSNKTLFDTDEDRISIDDITSYKGSQRLKKKSSFTSRLRRENDPSLRTPVPSMAFEDQNEANDIPMYPSSSSRKYPKKKKGSFFLTQVGNSPVGSDVSEQVSVI